MQARTKPSALLVASALVLTGSAAVLAQKNNADGELAETVDIHPALLDLAGVLM